MQSQGMSYLCAVVAVALLVSLCGLADAAPPEGNGLAARYPGDVGIERDPNVVWVERFEEATIAELSSRYDEALRAPNMSFQRDVPPGSPGRQSLKFGKSSSDSGSHLYKSFPKGYDQLFVRFYVKFPAPPPGQHFIWLGGYNPRTPYPQGGAGSRPVGNERLTSGVEAFSSTRWDFYTYWCGMHESGDHNYWGNYFICDKTFKVAMKEWTCVELMVKLNNPVTAHNGEQAIWINGRLHRQDGQITSWLAPGTPRGSWVWDHFIPDPSGRPFEGFQWRKADSLKLNFLWLEWFSRHDPPDYSLYLDHVVLSKTYIGPMMAGEALRAPKPAGSRKPTRD